MTFSWLHFWLFQGLKKPYNPILGETFRCCWPHPQSEGCTFYIAEQVTKKKTHSHKSGKQQFKLCKPTNQKHLQVWNRCQILTAPYLLSSSQCPCHNISFSRFRTIHPFLPFMSAIGRMVFPSVEASWQSPNSTVCSNLHLSVLVHFSAW